MGLIEIRLKTALTVLCQSEFLRIRSQENQLKRAFAMILED